MSRFGLMYCENLAAEFESVLKECGFPDILSASFPRHCGGKKPQWERMSVPISRMVEECDRIYIIGCGCATRILLPAIPGPSPRVVIPDILREIFLPPSLADSLVRQGSLLLVPGILDHQDEYFGCMGFDRSTTKAAVSESVRKIILLDTGVHPGSTARLSDISTFLGIPAECMDLGIQPIRNYLTIEYQKWRLEQVEQKCNDAITLANRKSANYAMVVDLLGKITGLHEEEAVIRNVLDLFMTLCSPTKTGFLPVDEGIPGMVTGIPAGSYDTPEAREWFLNLEEDYQVTEEKDGFFVRILHNRELMGVIAVERVSFPEHLDEYLNVSQFIGQVAGLALATTRTYRKLNIAIGKRDLEIAERKKTEAVLRDSEATARVLLNAPPDSAAMLIDTDGIIIAANNATEARFGKSVESLIGTNTFDLTAPEVSAERRVWFRQSIEIKKPVMFVDQRLGRDIENHVYPILSESGEVRQVAMIGRDITERRHFEEALHQANRKLNILNSITRHDILNTLMGLRAYIELSKMEVSDPTLSGYLEKEEQAAAAIQRQIEFTRFYQDIGVKKPAWQDVTATIRSAVSQLSLQKVVIEIKTEGLEIFADPLIEKVFYNLVENSLRHGGQVTRIGFSTSAAENGLILVYEDNGVGITVEDKRRLFEKGFGKHTGLGLFLTREILAITGISIVESGKPGHGVQFEMSLPRAGYRFSSVAAGNPGDISPQE